MRLTYLFTLCLFYNGILASMKAQLPNKPSTFNELHKMNQLHLKNTYLSQIDLRPRRTRTLTTEKSDHQKYLEEEAYIESHLPRRKRSLKSTIQKFKARIGLGFEEFVYKRHFRKLKETTTKSVRTRKTMTPTTPVRGWVKFDGTLPPRPFFAGWDGFGRRVYAGRGNCTQFGNSIFPGYVRETEDCLNVEYKGWGHCIPDFEILVGDTPWVDWYHPDIWPVGWGTHSKQQYFMCAFNHGNVTVIGKESRAKKECWANVKFGENSSVKTRHLVLAKCNDA